MCRNTSTISSNVSKIFAPFCTKFAAVLKNISKIVESNMSDFKKQRGLSYVLSNQSNRDGHTA